MSSPISATTHGRKLISTLSEFPTESTSVRTLIEKYLISTDKLFELTSIPMETINSLLLTDGRVQAYEVSGRKYWILRKGVRQPYPTTSPPPPLPDLASESPITSLTAAATASIAPTPTRTKRPYVRHTKPEDKTDAVEIPKRSRALLGKAGEDSPIFRRSSVRLRLTLLHLLTTVPTGMTISALTQRAKQGSADIVGLHVHALLSKGLLKKREVEAGVCQCCGSLLQGKQGVFTITPEGEKTLKNLSNVQDDLYALVGGNY